MADSLSSTDGAGREKHDFLRAFIEFYADEENYRTIGASMPVEVGQGSYARKALELLDAQRERTRVLEEALQIAVDHIEAELVTNPGDFASNDTRQVLDIARASLAAVAVEDEQKGLGYGPSVRGPAAQGSDAEEHPVVVTADGEVQYPVPLNADECHALLTQYKSGDLGRADQKLRRALKALDAIASSEPEAAGTRMIPEGRTDG